MNVYLPTQLDESRIWLEFMNKSFKRSFKEEWLNKSEIR